MPRLFAFSHGGTPGRPHAGLARARPGRSRAPAVIMCGSLQWVVGAERPFPVSAGLGGLQVRPPEASPSILLCPAVRTRARGPVVAVAARNSPPAHPPMRDGCNFGPRTRWIGCCRFRPRSRRVRPERAGSRRKSAGRGGLLVAVPADVDTPGRDGPDDNADISRDEGADLTFWGSRCAARVP
jgi:hypothetical protein